jgi:hypothetical protein
MKLEALCKQNTEVAQKLGEEKATLEIMIESRDELIMEIADEIGLNHMGEDTNDEDEDDDNNEEDDDDGEHAAAPLAAMPPLILVPHAIALEEIIVEEEEDLAEMVPE